MFQKIVKTLITIVASFIIILLLAYGVSKSDFSNIKKYDEKGITSKSNLKERIAKERYYTTKVKIKDGGMANLGDFTLNISENRKLTANISLKFKDKQDSNWIEAKRAQQEILNKGDVLRSAVIQVISNNKDARISNNKMKKELVKTMNNYLSDGEVEEVYFNKFIIQHN